MNYFKIIMLISAVIIQSVYTQDSVQSTEAVKPAKETLQSSENADSRDDRVINPKFLTPERQTEICIDICIECFTDHSTLKKYEVNIYKI